LIHLHFLFSAFAIQHRLDTAFVILWSNKASIKMKKHFWHARHFSRRAPEFIASNLHPLQSQQKAVPWCE